MPPFPTTVEARTVPKVTRLTPPTGVLAGESAIYLLVHLILSSHPPPGNSWPETRPLGAQCAANESFVIDTSTIPSAHPMSLQMSHKALPSFSGLSQPSQINKTRGQAKDPLSAGHSSMGGRGGLHFLGVWYTGAQAIVIIPTPLAPGGRGKG